MLTLDQSPDIEPILISVSVASAQGTAAILLWLGTDVRQDGIWVSHAQGFTYAIDFSCTGFIPFIFLGVAIAFFPAAARRRLSGFLLSVPYVFGINQLRLVSLFYIGVEQPEAFQFIHEVFWECLMVVFIAGFWMLWIRGTMKKRQYRTGATEP